MRASSLRVDMGNPGLIVEKELFSPYYKFLEGKERPN